MLRVLIACLVMSAASFASSQAAAAEPVAADPVTTPLPVTDDPAALAFFEQHVRPLLVNKCQSCHGPDKQESSLRLDARETILQGGVSGPAITAEFSPDSLLLQAVRGEDGMQMPPDEPLTAAEIAILADWVARGIPMPAVELTSSLRGGPITDAERRHWAFQPLKNPEVPAVHDTAWPRTEIDRFLQARWEAEGIRPVADADKRTLLRRATIDLTGLQPTAEEMQGFLQDESADAYERLIERLLASPAYGERWGRHWLDLARYADTAGDGADYPTPEAYRYRNYVIDAVNADLPYDQFIREQIAGDILAKQKADQITPEEYARQVTATGYLAVTKRFGYNINTEFQHLDISDTLDVVGQSLLGLSIGCARCHDHKYEPITAADYYALYGIFSSSNYSFPGGEEYKRPHNMVPLATPTKLAELEQQRKAELAVFDGQLQAIAQQRRPLEEVVGSGVDLAFEAQAMGQPPAAPWFTAGPNQILAEAQSPYQHVYPAGTRGLRIGSAGTHDGLRQEFPAWRAAETSRLYFSIDFRNTDVGEGGAYRFYLGHGAIISLALECSITADGFAIRNGDMFQQIRPLKLNEWYSLQLELDLASKTYHGQIGRPGDMVQIPTAALAPGWDGVIDAFVTDGLGQATGPRPTHDVDNLAVQTRPISFLDQTPVASIDEQQLAAAREQLEQLSAQSKQIQQQRDQRAAQPLCDQAYGMSEGTPANARIQKRGEPLRLGDEVPRRFLEVLGGDLVPADSSGSGRLELAHWLTRNSNPLTPRVFVNRVWQHHFGRGIVSTASDFGTRGEPASHPELLDYLTSRFVAEGWSLKKLHRWIMHSRAYQLSSADNPEQFAMDPHGAIFWRQRRRALDAETLRDSMLAISGELDRNQPAGHPFPPVEKWTYTIHYPFHEVYDSKHRSVYLMSQRSRRHPFLSLFDANDPNISTPQRQTTITPTQALYLMNSPAVHQQSAVLAGQLLAGESAEPSRIAAAYQRILLREPTAEEVADAGGFLQDYRAAWSTVAPEAVDIERGAWGALVRVLWTSNEFLYVD